MGPTTDPYLHHASNLVLGAPFFTTSTATIERDVPLAEFEKFSITHILDWAELLFISAGYRHAGAAIRILKV
jgi:hypothetical protein